MNHWILRSLLGLGSALLALDAGAAFADTSSSFQAIYAAPDDLAQDLAYARAEARAGRLLNAAAALERILLLTPNENGVRLFYVAVLYRLDDLQGARQQLDALDPSTLTPVQKAEADKYRERISEERNDFKFSGNIAAGLGADSDPLGALATQLDLFGVTPPKKAGDSAIASGQVELIQDLNRDGDLAAFGAASIYSRQTIGGPDADYLNTQVNLGINGSGLKTNWEVGALFRDYQLFDAPYLAEYGGRAAFNWSPNTSVTWIASFEGVGQSFHEPYVKQFVPAFISGTHNGARYDLTTGVSYRASATDTISAAVGYELKTAGYEPFAYDAPFIHANYQSLLGGGAYFDFGGELRYVDYRKFDAFFLDARREDMRGTGRMALGAPLSSFWPEKATGDYRENIIVEGATTYTERTSKTPIAPYNDLGFEMRLIWKFGDTR
ncbi:MAG TPA: hypothetical protein VMD53_08715 [Rhizomicrobium sp.]|nr:hypothetical protein [Rhizomicrobium sp.]